MDESGLQAVSIINRSEFLSALNLASLYIDAWHDMQRHGLAGKYASCKAPAHSDIYKRIYLHNL